MKQWLLGLVLFCLAMPAIASEDWTLTDTAGKTMRLSDYRGQWVLVNFWATWCPPCLAEIPDFIGMRRSGEKIAVIGIAVSYRNKDEVLDFVKKHAIPYPIVLGSEDSASSFGGIDTLPASFLYSPDGKLVGQHEGPLTQEEILSFIKGSGMNIIKR